MIKGTSSKSALRKMRQKIFDYDNTPNEKKAERVLRYLKKRVLRQRKQERENAPVGQYSRLTRQELAKTGTCETDWY